MRASQNDLTNLKTTGILENLALMRDGDLPVTDGHKGSLTAFPGPFLKVVYITILISMTDTDIHVHVHVQRKKHWSAFNRIRTINFSGGIKRQ